MSHPKQYVVLLEYTGGRKLTEGGLGAMGMTLNLHSFPGVVTHVDVGLW